MKPRAGALASYVVGLVGLGVVAACSSETESVTGAIEFALGVSAPLTIGDETGSGFSLEASIGSDSIESGASDEWHCYAPDGDENPNYEIYASNGSTWSFYASVVPAMWVVGDLEIDDEHVIVSLSNASSIVSATAGLLTLTRADEVPDTAGNYCAFSTTSLQLSGETR